MRPYGQYSYAAMVAAAMPDLIDHHIYIYILHVMFRLGFTNVKTKVPAPRGSTRFSSIILSFPKAFCKVCWQLSACFAKCICFNARRIMHISHPCKCSKNPRCACLHRKNQRPCGMMPSYLFSACIARDRPGRAFERLCPSGRLAAVGRPACCLLAF